MKINIKNKATEIESLLRDVQKGCTTGILTYADIYRMSLRVSTNISNYPKSTIQGAFAANIEYIEFSCKDKSFYTQVTLKLGGNGVWFVTGLSRVIRNHSNHDDGIAIFKTSAMMDWEASQISDRIII